MDNLICYVDLLKQLLCIAIINPPACNYIIIVKPLLPQPNLLSTAASPLGRPQRLLPIPPLPLPLPLPPPRQPPPGRRGQQPLRLRRVEERRERDGPQHPHLALLVGGAAQVGGRLGAARSRWWDDWLLSGWVGCQRQRQS
jgi:hypothetical protein